MSEDVIILGTGPAGYTAAIYAARADLNPLVIEGEEPGGQLMLTTEVENFPGFPEGILGPDLMEAMKKQAERFGAKFIPGRAASVDLSRRPFKVTTDDDKTYEANALIISTGASAKMLEIPGEQEMVGHGVSTCATCDGFFFKNKRILVVGGGDSAMEEATFLTRYASEVTIVHRRDQLRASKIMQERAQKNPKISWVMNAVPVEVLSENNKVTGLKVRHNDSGKEEVLPTEGLFVSIGHRPNTAFLNGQVDTDTVGYIITHDGSTRTSVDGVFACGDVADSRYRQAITAAGTGCRAAMDVERWLETQGR
ncbi:thioredoxin-disulfide reductase [Sulfobacillus harzensis]|uniref:Thioredoxin reductase n=1 Tax=Sulfobacillus harzensis TaxID=2729629 RepID=A0A7Y0Q3P8_9FIRM|nr:thioredoxin-disulfide reductase [Sulfobacillus harzensis]NMP23221.1 thioredoxin-disulfide reductase [Sulfobacillus harzensis]